MSKFAVVLFPDGTKAIQGARALQDLHREAIVTVFGAVIVHRQPGGALSAGRRSVDLPLGLGVTALAGGLMALFGGPLGGGGMGYAGEALAVGWRDYLHAGVSDEFIERIVRELGPGTHAIVAELSEESVAPLDVRMRVLGGKVIRDERADFMDELLENAADVRRAELAARRAERAAARTARTFAELARAVAEAEENLDRTASEIRERLDHAREEVEAKIAALEEQAEDATLEVRARIERRIAALRGEFAACARRLERAHRLAWSAAHPEVAAARAQG